MQQAIILALLAGPAAWFALTWSRSPAIAWAGFALIPMLYCGGLALEFVALRTVNRTDPVPQAGALMLARAWLAETLQAPRIFGWRQPFRSDAIEDSLAPDHGIGQRRGVVFIHGFVCNRGFWTPWLRRVRAAHHPFAAVNLEPVFGAIDEYVPIIERAVVAVAQAGAGHADQHLRTRRLRRRTLHPLKRRVVLGDAIASVGHGIVPDKNAK